MAQLNIAEAKAHFSEIIQKALLGEEVVISKGNRPLVKIVPLTSSVKKRSPGTGKGQLVKMAEDFDDPLEDFKEYM